MSPEADAADVTSLRAKPQAVLFLGDRGGHRPADRFEQLAPVLAGRGIELTYTEIVSDLNPENLGKYDALVIYANTTEISMGQEKALLDYVAGGGGADVSAGAKHTRAAAVFLTGSVAEKGAQAHRGTSVDQVAAQHIGQDKPLPAHGLTNEEAGTACGAEFS